jgi:hypothetical protein
LADEVVAEYERKGVKIEKNLFPNETINVER